jgi:hypothetical protein
VDETENIIYEKKIMGKFVSFSFSNKAGEILTLKYCLYDHQLTDRWIALMKKSLENKFLQYESQFYGKRFTNEKELEEKINRCLSTINWFAEKNKFPAIHSSLQAKIPMSIEFLNETHKHFEHISQFKKLNFVPELRKSAFDLNVAVHQAEQFTSLGDYPSDHIQLSIFPQLFNELEEKDYELFTPDLFFGELYLNYGMAGVPTKEAFIHDTEMRPQSVYANGMMLSFIQDLKFNRWDELNKWLTKKGHDPKDSRLAIGSIPLGKLTEPIIDSSEEFLIKLGQFQNFTNVEFS